MRCDATADERQMRASAGRGPTDWRNQNRLRLRPDLLVLEERKLLAPFTVTSTLDNGSVGTLRWAVGQANAAGGAETIDFDSTVFKQPQTITLTGAQLALSDKTGTETIIGPKAGVTVSGDGLSRVIQVGTGVTASISGLTITGGSASTGGGLMNYGGMSLTNCTISGNSASGIGGGLTNEVGATTTLIDCAVRDNSVSGNSASGNAGSRDGGGVANARSGMIALFDCTISGNSTADDGGGVLNEGTATVTDCTISGNFARDTDSGQGGGLCNISESPFTLTGCTISGNSAAAVGGGLYSGSAVTLTGCTLSDNTAGRGGGFYNHSAATLTGCTVTGNIANRGGGLLENGYGTLALTSCTISGNSAVLEGGGLDALHQVTLSDTIIAANAGAGNRASDIEGTFKVAGSHNLIGIGGSDGITDGSSGNIILTSLVNLGLGPLADNGGPTLTMALLPGSLAIDAGSNSLAVNANGNPLTTDQRGTGYPRIVGGVVDIGAYENPGLPAVVSLTTSAAGGVSTYGHSVTFTATVGVHGGTGAPTGSVEFFDGSKDLGAGTKLAGSAASATSTFTSSTFSVATHPIKALYTRTGDSQGTTSGTVSQIVEPATVTPLIEANNKGYDGTTTATLSRMTLDGVIGTDAISLTVGSSAFADKNAGTGKTVTARGLALAGAAAGNCRLAATAATTTANVTPAPLTVPGITATSKVYDGTTVATLDTGSAKLVGVFKGDTVALETKGATGSFASPHAGNALTVTVAGLSIAGAQASDYSLTHPALSASIVRAIPTLTLSAPGGSHDGGSSSASVTVAGTVGARTPAASLEGVTPILTYYAGSGTSGTNLGHAPPSESGTYTVVAGFQGSADYAAVQSAPVTFTINQGPASVLLTSSGGSAVFGQSVTFTARVSGAGTPSGSVTFADGGATLGTVALDGAGSAALSTFALTIGLHSITAAYSGSADFPAASSGATSVSVARAGTQIVFAPHAVFKKKKLVSLSLEALIEPLTPGGGVPTGTVTIELKQKKKVKVLGTAALKGGEFTLTVKPASVLKQSITIIYGGDPDFQTSTLPPVTLTTSSLSALGRPKLSASSTATSSLRPR
jgi:hypothetical protein